MDTNQILIQAQSFQNNKDFEKAVSLYQKALLFDKNNLFALNNLAMIYLEQNKPEKALDCLHRLLKINNTFPQPWRNLGLVYNRLNQYNKALKCFQKSVSLDPNYLNGLVDLFLTANFLAKKEAAKKALRKIIKIQPNSPYGYYNLGNLYYQEKEYSKAIKCFKKTLETDKNFTSVYNNLYLCYKKACLWEKLSDIEKQLEKISDEDPYVNLIRTEDPEKNYLAARNFAEKIKKNLPKIRFSYSQNKNKIRVGYIARDFFVLNNTEKQVFSSTKNLEVFVFYYGESQKEEKKIKKISKNFINLKNQDNLQAAQIINNLEINILVDLAGYTYGARPEILALKPAPIQITWLGFPGTTGASFFDYILADKTLVKKEEKDFYQEKLIFLPGCYQINASFQPIAYDFKRENFGLKDNQIVFCSFSQSYKFDPVMFKLWIEILQEVKNSVLWLSDNGKEANNNILDFCQKNGLEKSRIIFSSYLPSKTDHLKRLSLADIALDTYIFGGHLTISDYLRAKLPVITRYGGHLISRVAASVLKTYGIPELITSSLNEYKNLAIDLGKNPQKIKKIKEKINTLARNNPLFDSQNFAKKLEKAYLEVWKNYLQNLNQDIIEIK